MAKSKIRAPKMKAPKICSSNICIMVLLLFILFFVLYTQTNIFNNKIIEGNTSDADKHVHKLCDPDPDCYNTCKNDNDDIKTKECCYFQKCLITPMECSMKEYNTDKTISDNERNQKFKTITNFLAPIYTTERAFQCPPTVGAGDPKSVPAMSHSNSIDLDSSDKNDNSDKNENSDKNDTSDNHWLKF